MSQVNLMEEDNRPIDDVLAPFVENGVFIKDFWMKNRVGAMVGASVADYKAANAIPYGKKPRHMAVVGPDVEGLNWNEVMTSPGTNGWIPAGATYQWNKNLTPDQNFDFWVASGAPKSNQFGRWATAGMPQAYVEETWKHPSARNLAQFCEQYGLGCSEARRNKDGGHKGEGKALKEQMGQNPRPSVTDAQWEEFTKMSTRDKLNALHIHDEYYNGIRLRWIAVNGADQMAWQAQLTKWMFEN